jgi:hypothetical protein
MDPRATMAARWRAERVSFALLQQLTASPSGEKTDASGQKAGQHLPNGRPCSLGSELFQDG